jgi:hypothetical protein
MNIDLCYICEMKCKDEFLVFQFHQKLYVHEECFQNSSGLDLFNESSRERPTCCCCWRATNDTFIWFIGKQYKYAFNKKCLERIVGEEIYSHMQIFAQSNYDKQYAELLK